LFYVVAAFVLLMGALCIVLGSAMNEALRNEHDRKGSALAANVASMSADHVLVDSPVTLGSMLEEAKGTDREIVYMFVLDKRGMVVSDTFNGAFPRDLLEITAAGPNGPAKSPVFRTEKGLVADFAAPIMHGMAGTLHLGLSEQNVEERIGEVRQRLAIVTLAFLLVGVLASHLLAAYITRPLDDLVLAAGEMGRGNLDRRSRVRTRDEIGILSAAFNRMGDELRRAHNELEMRVKERTAQLADANRELEAFSYSVSHDLRAPLRGIEGFSLSLQTNYSGKMDETGKEYIRRIRNGCARMTSLIDDLLKLSRLTRGELRRETVDLSALAFSIAEERRESSPGRTVEVVVAPGMFAQGDPTLLRAALDNLIGNAWKFTRDSEIPRIEIGISPGSEIPVYFVRDNGAGFDMDYSEKLFGAFQRLHSAAEFEGSGIGLATVKRIVHRHGGAVWAEGEVGRGATFYFSLDGGARGKTS